jgi:hypothetical protein
MKMLVTAATAVAATLLVTSPVLAHDYYNAKWFDYPDGPSRLIPGGCAKWIKVFGTDQCIQPNLPRVELERRDVKVIVRGPDSADQAVENALAGYAFACVATALAASTAGPQIVAAPGGFFAAFKGCIAALSVEGTAGAILRQFDISIDNSGTHWSPA